MSFLKELAEQRQRFLDGIEANQGDINLSIFEDFYPDEAHFIYELLQNAEDAGATEVMFELGPQACYFEHNGSRHFNEVDIRAITGIHNSSKKNKPDRIGKFGVGFKSVFVYTETPIIYSRDYSFKILKLVMPQAVPHLPDLGEKTRFEFPFNNSKKSIKEAYEEIRSGLQQLSETTLLFLSNLQLIRWKIGSQEGAVLRHEHSESHLEVLKQVDGSDVLSSHWLRFVAPVENIHQFTAPADGVERQKVAIAFELDFRGEQNSFDTTRSITEQLRVAPAVKGKVSVFFPAEKETSGLRFHLHAPFIPELSRASIKNSPENTPLIEQLAKLSARALHTVKDLGLLTGDFLAVLPNNDDPLAERYKVIRTAIMNEMKSQALVPTYAGGFAPGSRLYQSRASIKALLSDEDLAFVTERQDKPTWAIGATQKNQNQDKFLSSLGIPTWDAEDLKDFFEAFARVTSYSWLDARVDPAVMTWLGSKSSEWHQALYAILNKYCGEEDDYFSLRETQIVRMVDGTHRLPEEAYFQTGPASVKDPLPRVDEEVFTIGTKKGQQSEARKFLASIGVRVPGELEEIKLLLQSRYGPEGDPPSDKVYLADLKLFMAFAEKNPQCREMMADAFLFRADSPEFEWYKAGGVYLDAPFVNTGLRTFYESIKDERPKRWPLSDWYKVQSVELDKLVKFFDFAGVEREFHGLCAETTCYDNENYRYLSQVGGERYTSPINRDFTLTQRAYDMLRLNTVEGAKLVWIAMCRARASVLQACYRKNERNGARYANSQLICWLRDLAWVPQRGGYFVKPSAAHASQLPEGFPVDAGFKWLELVEFGKDDKKRVADNAVRATRRAELGFNSEEELQDALEFARLPKDERVRLLAEAEKCPPEPFELPERLVRNPELRQQRVGDEATKTPEKTSVQRQRSVQVGVAEAKAEAKVYLADQYTNLSGQMVCQVCKGELPFKLPTGAYYFEAVELVPDSPKRYREAYLALCPNHAAAYLYANEQRSSMHELVATAASNEIEIALGGDVTTLYFTQMHLVDAKACLNSEESEE
ncbi:sacsin N-terminal ATP-binding-like domain-containing protein [Stutzerimonas balearica]|uniref:sacsin N-terminal ATP-binding-like domain-containing protein n=1 Tax=Stutzerimonas balearica TaxID=74829 RepID=UPI0037870251